MNDPSYQGAQRPPVSEMPNSLRTSECDGLKSDIHNLLQTHRVQQEGLVEFGAQLAARDKTIERLKELVEAAFNEGFACGEDDLSANFGHSGAKLKMAVLFGMSMKQAAEYQAQGVWPDSILGLSAEPPATAGPPVVETRTNPEYDKWLFRQVTGASEGEKG